MAIHEQCVGATDEWYTPAYVFEALACSFDVDVASPGRHIVPWIPAREHITADSLSKQWRGYIWMNAPYGGRNALAAWLKKFVEHGNGIALTPDRTSAPWWSYAARMDLILFTAHKIKFLNAMCRPGPSPAQGNCLMGIGVQAREALHCARSLGVLMAPVKRAGDEPVKIIASLE